jgi:hypothetical protein
MKFAGRIRLEWQVYDYSDKTTIRMRILAPRVVCEVSLAAIPGDLHRCRQSRFRAVRGARRGAQKN